jgi:two-component system, NarL family, nitrate/nitrite response regulator NarL
MALRCLIVDDNPGFLDAAGKLLGQEGAVVVGVASTAEEALGRAAELEPEVTLIDIDLGAESGFDVARVLAADGSRAGSLILISTHLEDEFADLIEASPAIGFIPKSALSIEAIEALLTTPR